MSQTPDQSSLILAGRISAVHGVRGWVKVYSHTSPRENLLQYHPWWLELKGQWQQIKATGRRQGKLVLASFESISDRNQAEALIGASIYIERQQLPETQDDEYYWSDLIGCDVVTEVGESLGQVDDLLETGANDVLVVGTHLIPFVIDEIVTEVNLQQRRISVRWQADY